MYFCLSLFLLEMHLDGIERVGVRVFMSQSTCIFKRSGAAYLRLCEHILCIGFLYASYQVNE